MRLPCLISLSIVCLSAGLSRVDAAHAHNNNLAYAAPHAGMPQLAVQYSEQRHLEEGAECGAKSVAFKHGVASGDPFSDSVVIWTRVTPLAEQGAGSYPVTYVVASDKELKHVVKEGTTVTSAEVDYTVKLVVEGLHPATKYYYRFSACGGKVESITGTTKTAPAANADVQSVKLATVSCSRFDDGYFNAYGRIADKADGIDAVLHLGDYIYEYDASGRAPSEERVITPAVEIVTLQEYRARYQQYTTDKDLIRMRAALPLIAVPDDHEVTNNGWKDGAQNHQPDTEGDWQTRVDNAFRAYFEWIPARQFTADKQRLYRDFIYGKLLKIQMIDTRYNEREEQPASLSSEAQYAEWKADTLQRKIMSDAQMDWLVNGLQSAKQHWKLIGNQLLFTDRNNVEAQQKYSASGDQWVAYKASQNALLDGMVDVENVVINTGDIHSNYVYEAFMNPKTGKPYAVEYVGTSVTSSNPADGIRRRDISAAEKERLIAEQVADRKENPALVDTDIDCHGYFLSTYTKDELLVDYYCVDVQTSNSEETTLWNWKTCSGSSTVVEAAVSC